jgi:hypothetical protein
MIEGTFSDYWTLERIERVCGFKRRRGIEMTLCPIALVVGCKKCPAFTVCPLKSVIGDYKKPEEMHTKQDAEKAQTGVKRDE